MDLDDQADEAWLLSVQRKLYQWSRTSYRDVWNLITDIRNVRCAWRKIALNKGRRTAGVNGCATNGIPGSAICRESRSPPANERTFGTQ